MYVCEAELRCSNISLFLQNLHKSWKECAKKKSDNVFDKTDINSWMVFAAHLVNFPHK